MNMFSMRRSVLLLLLLTTSAFPQTTASLPSRAVTGTVHDSSDAVIIGASVELLGEDGKTIAQATTDNTGAFRFDRLSPGKYELHVQQEGFSEATIAVTLGTKPYPALHIALSVFADNQEVTVRADELDSNVSADIAPNQNANSVDRAALDRVPVFDQDYITTLSRFLDDSAIGTNGVTLVVNGVEANGPGVSASAVKDVKINQNPYSALFSRPGRARIEITTKGGTPDFHGSINFMFRDAVFDARNPFATV